MHLTRVFTIEQFGSPRHGSKGGFIRLKTDNLLELNLALDEDSLLPATYNLSLEGEEGLMRLGDCSTGNDQAVRT